VNNRLSNLEIGLRNLQFDLGKAVSAAEAKAEVALANLSGKVDRLVGMTQEVTKTARLFQRLIKADRWEQIDLGDLLEHSRQNLAQQAYQAGVYVDFEHQRDAPLIVSSEARLQQVFLNLMLNAIQQGGKGTQLIVRTTYAPEDAERPVKIRFHDTGPGIHRRLFEKVFDYGFTTRQDGNGLGLYISRGLIESLGGRICIESSYVLIGTTFLVELPLRAPGREESGE
jgi:signal transduction histidine kinase